MLSAQDNALITQTGRARRWASCSAASGCPCCCPRSCPSPDCPPIRIKVLGEYLVAFRDTNGNVGLVDAFCPHRRAPLFYGRNEECGLRCVYHGWKFDSTGQCVDMPSEPADSDFKDKVQIDAYPTREWGGVIWAYMGPREHMPATPPQMEWAWSRRAAARHQELPGVQLPAGARGRHRHRARLVPALEQSAAAAEPGRRARPSAASTKRPNSWC